MLKELERKPRMLGSNCWVETKRPHFSLPPSQPLVWSRVWFCHQYHGGKMTYSEHITWLLKQNDCRLSLPRGIILKAFSKFKSNREKKSLQILCAWKHLDSFHFEVLFIQVQEDLMAKLREMEQSTYLLSSPFDWEIISWCLSPWEGPYLSVPLSLWLWNEYCHNHPYLVELLGGLAMPAT